MKIQQHSPAEKQRTGAVILSGSEESPLFSCALAHGDSSLRSACPGWLVNDKLYPGYRFFTGFTQWAN